MAQIIINFNKFEKDLKAFATRNILPKVVKKAAVLALPRLRQELVRSFKRTIFVQGLRDKYTNVDFLDVRGNLGFNDSDAENIIDDIAEIFQNSFNDVTEQSLSFQKFALKFDITTSDIEDSIRSQIDGSYTSAGDDGSFEVEWLQSLLDGWETPGYDILFNIDSEFSRSERAIMVKSTKKSWSSEDYNNFARVGYKNFVEETINDELFIERSQKIILESLRKSLNE